MIKKVLPVILLAQGAHMYGQKEEKMKDKDKEMQKEAVKKKMKKMKEGK